MAFLLMFTIVFTMARNLVIGKANQKGKNNLHSVSKPLAATIGSFSGLFASLSGLGGGVVIVPILSEFCKISLRLSQTTSLIVVSISSLMLTLSNLATYENGLVWHLDLYKKNIVLPIVTGILIGTPIGNWLYPKIPAWLNKLLFIAVLSYIGYINLKMLFV